MPLTNRECHSGRAHVSALGPASAVSSSSLERRCRLLSPERVARRTCSLSFGAFICMGTVVGEILVWGPVMPSAFAGRWSRPPELAVTSSARDSPSATTHGHGHHGPQSVPPLH